MPYRNRLIVALTCLLVSTGAWAGLKETAPKGVELQGLWKLDPLRSDDPDAVLSQARADAEKSAGGSGGGMRHGGYGRRGGGGGFPGGGWGHRGGGGGQQSSDDSSGDSQSKSGTGTTTSPRRQLLQDLSANPATLDFAANDRALKISAEQSDVECAAGVKVAISDGAGAAERNCGWDGRAWVIETERGKVLKRTDRYELSKDGKTLTYVTTATGTKLPKIKITRTYTAAF